MQGSLREIAVDLVRADGERLPALINAAVARDEEGRPRFIRTALFIAAARRAYERELLRERQRAEEARRAKADFLSLLSHEIRTPLTSILGAAQLITLPQLTDEQKTTLARVLRSASSNLLHLINDILDSSKLEAGMLTLEETALDLRQVAAGVAASLEGKAAEKGIGLVLRVDDRVPAGLLGDPVKIGQVLTNLVGNAIKFTHQGEVTVEVALRERDGHGAEIGFRIADTGIGIAADRLPHIFDEYTQAGDDIGRRYGGTGLGLSISKRLVELHGSRLGVESEPGRGTAFACTLRLRIAPPLGSAAAESE
jgi:signal transduction histidine kinase